MASPLRRTSSLCTLGVLVLALGCGGTTGDGDGSGGTTSDGSGGANAAGGNVGSGATPGSGAAPGSGGVKGTGGAGAQANEGGEPGAGGSLPETCEDGEQVPAPDGCNTCICSDGGWACTLIGCVDPGDVNCGGWLGDTCQEDEYCAYEEGEACGAADASSVCLARPNGCSLEYAPVCGCDGETYANSCIAANAGTGVYQAGPCD